MVERVARGYACWVDRVGERMYFCTKWPRSLYVMSENKDTGRNMCDTVGVTNEAALCAETEQ